MGELFELREHQEKMMDSEAWKPVIGFEDSYEVSNQGRVRSLDRIVRKPNKWGGISECRKKGCVLRLYKGEHGRLHVTLQSGGRDARRATLQVHRVVMAAFSGACPVGYVVAHNDGNPTNNTLNNLRYDTQKGNLSDMVRHGTRRSGEKHHASKLTVEDVKKIKKLLGKKKQAEIAKMFGVKQMAISRINCGVTWRCVDGV